MKDYKTHQIKTDIPYFEDILSGRKCFELRKNDRGYKVGDSLKLLEFNGKECTGRVLYADITYLLESYAGLEDGYCILGIVIKQ